MEASPTGLTASSASTLPALWRLVSLHQRRQLLYAATGARARVGLAPTTSSEASTLWPFLPHHPASSSLPSQALHTWTLPSPSSLPRHGNHDPGSPRGIPRHSRMPVSLAPLPELRLWLLTFLAGSCFLLAGLNLIFLHSFWFILSTLFNKIGYVFSLSIFIFSIPIFPLMV